MILTSARRILARPLAILLADARIVAHQNASLGALEERHRADSSHLRLDNQAVAHIWQIADNLNALGRLVAPVAMLRAQSPRDAVQLVVDIALVQHSGAIVGGIRGQGHLAVRYVLRCSTLHICKSSILYSIHAHTYIHILWSLIGLLTDTLWYNAAPLAVIRAGSQCLAHHFIPTLTTVFRQRSNSEMPTTRLHFNKLVSMQDFVQDSIFKVS